MWVCCHQQAENILESCILAVYFSMCFFVLFCWMIKTTTYIIRNVSFTSNFHWTYFIIFVFKYFLIYLSILFFSISFIALVVHLKIFTKENYLKKKLPKIKKKNINIHTYIFQFNCKDVSNFNYICYQTSTSNEHKSCNNSTFNKLKLHCHCCNILLLTVPFLYKPLIWFAFPFPFWVKTVCVL